MTNHLSPERNLYYARACLVGASERLTTFRRLGQLNSNDHHLLKLAERDYCFALDDVWAAQQAVAA